MVYFQLQIHPWFLVKNHHCQNSLHFKLAGIHDIAWDLLKILLGYFGIKFSNFSYLNLATLMPSEEHSNVCLRKSLFI